MESQTDRPQFPRQFSIRTILLVVFGLAGCMALVTVQLRNVRERNFLNNSVYPIVNNYVSSIGYQNGHILWLRLNNIDPHSDAAIHGYSQRELDQYVSQWEVPIVMDMHINDGSFGPYKTFGDSQLRKIVAQHREIRALDLRQSSVSSAGVQHLAKLQHLEWLWLDARQLNSEGIGKLREISSLRKVWIDDEPLDFEQPSLAR